MIDKAKLERLIELKADHEKIEKEINDLLGGEPKKTWSRKKKNPAEAGTTIAAPSL